MPALYLLWLDDRPEDITTLIKSAKKKFDQVIVRRNLQPLQDDLEKYTKDATEISVCGIVIDVMLEHVKNLGSVGLENVKTPGGFTVGLEFIKYIISSKFPDIPICLLTIIDDHRAKELFKEKVDPDSEIKVVEKFSGNWQEQMEKWFDTIIKQAGGGNHE
ncbi:MAG: hypothetical protein JRE64_03270 [Deltaproteobacteria bacterium]|nr:hypothetical protein [Deltaproteobacteria bacterium]